MEPFGGMRKIGDLISQVLARRGYSQVTAQLELEQAWRKVAGDRVHRHARIGQFRAGTLEVLVDNAVLLGELECYQKETLLEAMQETVRHRSIRSLKFRRA